MNSIFTNKRLSKAKEDLVNYAKELVEKFKDDEEIVHTEFYKECLELSKR